MNMPVTAPQTSRSFFPFRRQGGRNPRRLDRCKPGLFAKCEQYRLRAIIALFKIGFRQSGFFVLIHRSNTFATFYSQHHTIITLVLSIWSAKSRRKRARPGLPARPYIYPKNLECLERRTICSTYGYRTSKSFFVDLNVITYRSSPCSRRKSIE